MNSSLIGDPIIGSSNILFAPAAPHLSITSFITHGSACLLSLASRAACSTNSRLFSSASLILTWLAHIFSYRSWRRQGCALMDSSCWAYFWSCHADYRNRTSSNYYYHSN